MTVKFDIGFYNRIIPPELYREDLSYVDLSRNVLNCSLCPNTDCHSKKIDIDTTKKEIYFVIDEFFDSTQNDNLYLHFLYNQLLVKYPDTDINKVHVIPSFKTEGGQAMYCSDFLRDEILLNAPKRVYYFSNYLPSISKNISNYGEYEMIGYSALISLPNINLFLNGQHDLQQYL